MPWGPYFTSPPFGPVDEPRTDFTDFPRLQVTYSRSVLPIVSERNFCERRNAVDLISVSGAAGKD
jgi:hypothetical protein